MKTEYNTNIYISVKSVPNSCYILTFGNNLNTGKLTQYRCSDVMIIELSARTD